MMVSVIVPCYNMEQYLDETLTSVLNQDFENWECIIVNDGSTDNSAQLAERWLTLDERFKYLSKPNGGLPGARNFGIKSAAGEIIVPLDADDLLSHSFLGKCINFLKENKEFRLVYTQTQLFGQREELWNDEFDYNEFSKRNLIPCTACFYKEDWEIAGGYDESLKNGFEDWDFWISLVEKGIRVHKIKEPLFYYRQRSDSMTQKLSQEVARELRDRIGYNHLEFFANNFGNPLSLYYAQKEMQRKVDLIQNSRTFKLVMTINKIYSRLLRR